MQSFSEAALGFEPGPGQLGVVLAQAGVGKTAFLVHLGIDQALAGNHVLHVAVGSRVEHVQSWYDALWRERFPAGSDEERSEVHRRCIIQCLSPGVSLRAERVEEWVQLYQDHSHLHPRVILIDGFDWEGPLVAQAAQLGALRSLARSRSAFLWLSAPTHQPVARASATLLPPVAAYESVIDHAAALVSKRDQVLVRRLRAFGAPSTEPGDVPFSPESLGLSHAETVSERPPLPREAYTLLSGGAAGAETLFGECAEAWHMSEIHFSFPGRRVHRDRGLVELTQKELEQGDVSLSYVEQQLGRRFPRTRQFHTLLQTIWHQVATAREIFIVGLLLPDGTVNGGTGWAAELGKHLGKQIHVFDQESKRWFRWTEDTWAVEGPPRITHTRFTGTGTRYLSDSGRAAIVELFERSFGPRPE